MRKVRKNLTGLICSTLLLSTATTAFAADTRAVVVHCPNCSTGTVYTYTSRSYEHDEVFPCSHGLTGTDTYKVYEVTVTQDCNSCSYSKSYSYEDHVLKSCNGH